VNVTAAPSVNLDAKDIYHTLSVRIFV